VIRLFPVPCDRFAKSIAKEVSMKRVTQAVLLAAILFLMAAAPAAAAPDKAPGSISVTGHAEATVVPDVAVVSAGIVTVGADVESARSENDRVMRRIIEAVTAQGVARTKIVTSQFSLQPVYRPDNKDGLAAITGYRLQNNVMITVEDLAKVGPVIDAAFGAGANQFGGLRFGLKDDGKLRDELLRQAIQDGRRKAAIIAEALGTGLGQPLSVTESGRVVPMPADNFRLLKAGAGSAPIEAGSLTLGIDVNMVFSL
jgi:uncharacterized protein YggE